MKYLKMFIAGMTLPSIFLPFAFLILSLFGVSQIFSTPFPHFLPIIWGIWNILYFTLFQKILPGTESGSLLITGAVLGLLVGLYGVFGLDIVQLMGFPESLTYLPIILVPIVYAILWRFIVNPLNHLLGIHTKHK